MVIKTKAHKVGFEDGATMARERIAELSDIPRQIGEEEFETYTNWKAIENLSGAKNFDEDIINNLTTKELKKILGAKSESEVQEKLAEYESGAKAGWEFVVSEALANR